MKRLISISALLLLLIFASCETEEARQQRLAQEKQQQIEIEQKRAVEEKAEFIRLEQVRIEQEKEAETERKEREARLEKERKEQEIYDRYISNSLSTGASPYLKYYGGNSSCNDYGC